MAAEDVARALIAMDDPDVRRRLAGGDFSGFELTAAEESLVSGATPVLPDGHPSMVLVAAGEVAAHGRGEDEGGYFPEGTAKAIAYANAELSDPVVEAEFGAWVRSARNEFP